MSETDTLEEVFKAITKRFIEISKQVDSITQTIENLGVNFNNSIIQISEQIENLTNTLQDLMKIPDLKNAKESIHKMVETFRNELDPNKLEKLLKDLANSVKIIKEKQKEKTDKE